MKQSLIVVGVLLALGLSIFNAFGTPDVQITPPSGATPGSDFTSLINVGGGMVNSGIIATSSMGSVTVGANEFTSWTKTSVVSLSPGLVAGATVTLPASSTIPSLVPKPGDRATFCVRNATTTAAVPLNFAGGTGTNLLVASSSATALGSAAIYTGKVACFTLVREPVTSTTFDIDVLMTVFK